MNIHSKAKELANKKIASNPAMYRAYADPLLFEVLVEECEKQLAFSNATFEINKLMESAHGQYII